MWYVLNETIVCQTLLTASSFSTLFLSNSQGERGFPGSPGFPGLQGPPVSWKVQDFLK